MATPESIAGFHLKSVNRAVSDFDLLAGGGLPFGAATDSYAGGAQGRCSRRSRRGPCLLQSCWGCLPRRISPREICNAAIVGCVSPSRQTFWDAPV